MRLELDSMRKTVAGLSNSVDSQVRRRAREAGARAGAQPRACWACLTRALVHPPAAQPAGRGRRRQA